MGGSDLREGMVEDPTGVARGRRVAVCDGLVPRDLTGSAFFAFCHSQDGMETAFS